MTVRPRDLVEQLRAQNVALTVDRGRLVVDGPTHAITAEVEEVLRANKSTIIEYLTREVDNGSPSTTPIEVFVPSSDPRERAFQLGRLGRQADYDAEATFALADEMFGRRSCGLFELSITEATALAEVLQGAIGTRPPIDAPTPASEVPVDDSIPVSIARKTALGWTDERFSRHCNRVLGRVGLRSVEDDRRVLAAMPDAPMRSETIAPSSSLDASLAHSLRQSPDGNNNDPHSLSVGTNHRRPNPPVTHSSTSRTEGLTK